MLLVIAGCSSSTATSSARHSPTSSSSTGGSSPSAIPAQGSGCVSQTEAMQIWNKADAKLNAIELDPKHAGVADVATGEAQQLINVYLQQQLVALNFTEKEVDKLDSLTVIDAGCNGGTLDLHVAIVLVRDDYLKPDGQVDHPDPQVGMTLHFDETFVRVSSVWKEANFSSLDQATPTPQLF